MEQESLTPSENKLAIVIITYNQADLLRLQVECIRKFCRDPHEIIVVDNSTEKEKIEAIRYHAGDLGCQHMKTNASSRNGSSSHSFSANFSYFKLHGKYGYFLYLDHDNFPVKPFSVKEILQDKVMAGLGQHKNGKDYFWPGCVMWDEKVINRLLINFSPDGEFQLDTGGSLYRVVDEYGIDRCVFFNEEHHENPGFQKSFYNFYAMIHGGTFMHFLNGSNWNGANDHEERINSLINILTDKMK